MNRREFIAGLGGVVAWPLNAWAQQGERLLGLGVLMGQAESDPEIQSWLAAFVQELARLDWAATYA